MSSCSQGFFGGCLQGYLNYSRWQKNPAPQVIIDLHKFLSFPLAISLAYQDLYTRNEAGFHQSGQIMIFHQARFPWNKESSRLTTPPFGVRLCEVAIFFGRWRGTSLVAPWMRLGPGWPAKPSDAKTNKYVTTCHLNILFAKRMFICSIINCKR